MPIIRYFVFVGGVLVALLFAADRNMPAPVDRTDNAGIDKTIIRIHSARGLPEKLVFDTRPHADVPAVATAVESVPEEHEDRIWEASAAIPAESPRKADNEPSVRKRTEERPRTKLSLKVARKPPDRRLAFDRHDFFGGWW
jgi:hypothetical protein